MEALRAFSVSHLPNRLLGARVGCFWYECKIKSKNALLGLFKDFDSDLYFMKGISTLFLQKRDCRKNEVCVVYSDILCLSDTCANLCAQL